MKCIRIEVFGMILTLTIHFQNPIAGCCKIPTPTDWQKYIHPVQYVVSKLTNIIHQKNAAIGCCQFVMDGIIRPSPIAFKPTLNKQSDDTPESF